MPVHLESPRVQEEAEVAERARDRSEQIAKAKELAAEWGTLGRASHFWQDLQGFAHEMSNWLWWLTRIKAVRAVIVSADGFE